MATIQKTTKIDNLEQEILIGANSVKLSSLLTEKDYWQTNGRIKRTILTHDAIKRLADMASINKAVEYAVLTQPNAYNNYQYTMQAKVCGISGECVVELGEANRSNLGSKGRNNPANMAQKRAYDRAVLRYLGITGLLSEEELSDQDPEEKMDELSHDDKRKIAPIINQLLLARSKKQMVLFNRAMKEKAKDFSEPQLTYLRKLYQKRLAELQKVSF